MHIVTAIRGEKMWLNRFIEDLGAKYVPYPTKIMPNGKPALIQLRVCPMQLYDISFPKENFDVVANTLFGAEKSPGGYKGTGWTKWQNFFLNLLRKKLRLKECPDYKTDNVLPVVKENLQIMCLGIKDDGVNGDGSEAI